MEIIRDQRNTVKVIRVLLVCHIVQVLGVQLFHFTIKLLEQSLPLEISLNLRFGPRNSEHTHYDKRSLK